MEEEVLKATQDRDDKQSGSAGIVRGTLRLEPSLPLLTAPVEKIDMFVRHEGSGSEQAREQCGRIHSASFMTDELK
jgi:hypothetical protein